MSPKTVQQNEEIKKQTIEKIVSAALSLMVKQGFEGTSIKDIATKADISVGLMYRYFESKQDLYNHILTDAYTGLEEVVSYLKSIPDPLTALRTIADIMVFEMATDDYINLHLIITQALMLYEDPIIEKIKKVNRVFADAIAELIKIGQQEKVFKQGCSSKYAWMFLASIQGAVLVKHVLEDDFVPPTTDDLLYYLMEVK